MKNYILFFIFLFVIFLFLTKLSLSCITVPVYDGSPDGTCCDGQGIFDNDEDCGFCVENNNEAYCGQCFGEILVTGPFKCDEYWSSKCCCNGTESLTCVPIPNADERIWGDIDCGRLNAMVDCNGVVNSHFICNNTYYPSAPKCTLMKPTINSYSVSKTNININDNFSITVNSNCPNGLPGKCLLECIVMHPDGHKIYLNSWDVAGYVTLPDVTCDKIGNYIVDSCGIFTDFVEHDGWGSLDDDNTTISCLSVPDSESPTYGSNNDDTNSNPINSGTKVNVYAKWEDNYGLGKAIIKTNMTGNWENYTLCYLSDNSSWCNKTIDTTGYSGIICWNQWANDTSSNWNTTMPVHCFNVTQLPDNAPPAYSYDKDDSKNPVNEGSIVSVSVLWQDAHSGNTLSKGILKHNISGSWKDNNTITFTSDPQWFNTTIDTKGFSGVACWIQTANDTSNNINNVMPFHCFSVTTSSEATSITDAESALQSIRQSISSSSAEFSLKVLTLAFEFLGIVILVILLVLVVQQIVQSH